MVSGAPSAVAACRLVVRCTLYATPTPRHATHHVLVWCMCRYGAPSEVWVAAWDPHHENVVYSGAACFDIHCADASFIKPLRRLRSAQGWMALSSTWVLRRRRGRLPVESWGPATRAAQHLSRCMLLVACCMCCLLHVATACCNVGADDCQWKVWDLRHAQRKPVFTCKPVAMGVTAVRIRSTSPS